MDRNQATDNLLKGALAGLAGGAAMAMMRMTLAPRMPKSMRPDEFVPKETVKWAEARAGMPHALGDSAEMGVGMAGHLAYSALGGSVYAVARPAISGLPAPVAGAMYGLLVWGVSFEGWLPALGVMERTTDKPVAKWISPLMGHMVYGAVTGMVLEALNSRSEDVMDDEVPSDRRTEYLTYGHLG